MTLNYNLKINTKNYFLKGVNNMKDSSFYIDEIKRKHGITSDYAVSKLLDVPRQSMTNFKNGRSSFDTNLVFKVAELTGHNELEIIANIRASKEKDPAFMKKWQALAKQLSGLAVSVLIGHFVLFGMLETQLNSPSFEFYSRIMSIMLSWPSIVLLYLSSYLISHFRPTQLYKPFRNHRTFCPIAVFKGFYYVAPQRKFNFIDTQTLRGF